MVRYQLKISRIRTIIYGITQSKLNGDKMKRKGHKINMISNNKHNQRSKIEDRNTNYNLGFILIIYDKFFF